MSPLETIAKALPDLELADAGAESIDRGGSDRTYHRIALADGGSVILMQYSDARPDNLKFIAAGKTLDRLGVPVPEILYDDPKGRVIVLQDLGNTHLWDHQDTAWKTRSKLYREALDQVAKLHNTTADDLSAEERDGLEPPFDEALYNWEQDYFFEQFLSRFSRRAPSYVRSLRHEPVFEELVTHLSELPRSLVHRDFQSQNLLIHDGRLVFIDYQGLRLGLPEYDIASLVYDPYVELTSAERDELIAYAFRDRDPSEWRPAFVRCAAQRLMQALGAYGRIGTELGKAEFLAYIPNALNSLRELLEDEPILPRLAPYLGEEALSL